MNALELALKCRELAERKKAENILILDLRGLSTLTDYFVIASGTSEPHLRAIVEEIVRGVEEECGLSPEGIDGTWASNWIVLDYYDVIVHIMRPEAREYYSLETLWGDAPRVQPEKISADHPL